MQVTSCGLRGTGCEVQGAGEGIRVAQCVVRDCSNRPHLIEIHAYHHLIVNISAGGGLILL